MGESVVFILPETNEEALFTIPVLTQYLLIRKVDKDREPVDEVTIVCSLKQLYPFIFSAWNGAFVTDDLDTEILNRADLIIEFDPERAYRITSNAQKHISEALGILLGGLPMALLPPIAQSNFKENIGSVLVVDRSPEDKKIDVEWKFKKQFVAMGKQAGITVDELDPNASFKDIVEEVSKASVIVGINSTATLVAASLGKIIFEMTQEGFKHKNWLAKLESRDYDLVYGDLDKMTSSFVWDRTQRLVAKCTKRDTQWDSPQSPTLDQPVVVGG